MTKRWLAWTGAVVSLGCGLYFLRAVAAHWQSLALTHWDGKVFLAMGAALLLYLATYVFATRAWQLGLRLLGHPAGFSRLARILMLSQFAKYLPGNVGHHVGRVVLAKRSGLPVDAIVASMVLDTALVLSAGAACSLPALALLLGVIHAHGAYAERAAFWVVFAGVVIAALLLAVPALRARIARLLGQGAARWSPSACWLLAQAWLNHCLSFLFGACALYLLCRAIADPAAIGILHPAWFEVAGIYASAWLAGFLMPGAPAGLGVRELVLLLGLSPLFGGEQAAIAAAILRLVTTAGDGLAFGLAAVVRRYAADEARP